MSRSRCCLDLYIYLSFHDFKIHYKICKSFRSTKCCKMLSSNVVMSPHSNKTSNVGKLFHVVIFSLSPNAL